MNHESLNHPTIVIPRYEIKIPLPARWLSDVEAWVRLHPAHWRVAYPPRRVNNVYFDTPAYDSLNANLSGIADRAKLRLRWYGVEVAQVRDAHLELKRKRGSVGWKEIASVDGRFALAGTTWRAFARALRAATTSQAHRWLDVYSLPVLINGYRRAYYATPDGVLRLTIDSALCAYDQRAAVRPNVYRPAPPDARVIVELKAPTTAGVIARLSAALTHFPAPVDRFSKYVTGLLSAPDID